MNQAELIPACRRSHSRAHLEPELASKRARGKTCFGSGKALKKPQKNFKKTSNKGMLPKH